MVKKPCIIKCVIKTIKYKGSEVEVEVEIGEVARLRQAQYVE